MNNKGKANKEVVINLINNLNEFNEIVREELRLMLASAQELNESWNDPQYYVFFDAVNELNSELRKDLDVLDEASQALAKKVALYD